jgi:hypothetical protein
LGVGMAMGFGPLMRLNDSAMTSGLDRTVKGPTLGNSAQLRLSA